MSSILEPPPPTKWNVLNLGAGVQSSALAMMAEQEIFTPRLDFAVFADTGSEPDEVYEWLEKLRSNVSFPIYTVFKGNLEDDELRVHKREDGSTYLKTNIPIFGIKDDGTITAALGRRCTSDYKIVPIQKLIKEKCGISRGQKDVTVTQWIGISRDEIQRVKIARDKWTQFRYPLIEQRITRTDCQGFIKRHFGVSAPRSACYYCPFHSDAEWRRIRDNDPKLFHKACNFDKKLRARMKKYHPQLKMREVYLHRSCLPLDQVDFDSDEDKGQQVWDFNAECEGMCGV